MDANFHIRLVHIHWKSFKFYGIVITVALYQRQFSQLLTQGLEAKEMF